MTHSLTHSSPLIVSHSLLTPLLVCCAGHGEWDGLVQRALRHAYSFKDECVATTRRQALAAARYARSKARRMSQADGGGGGGGGGVNALSRWKMSANAVVRSGFAAAAAADGMASPLQVLTSAFSRSSTYS